MTDQFNDTVATALSSYRNALRKARPSPQLGARIAASMRKHARDRKTSAHRWHMALWPAAAAILIAVVGTSLRPQARATVHRRAALPVQPSGPDLDLSSLASAHPAQLSSWTSQAAVVRVRGTLVTQPDEIQYWLDVRLASDGSMRIVKVIPAFPPPNGSTP